MRCFVAKGFGATSIADITEAAGVAKGTFYVHFDSKEALLDEALSEFNAGLATELAAIVPGHGVSLDRLVRAIVERFLAHWSANRELVRVYAERSTFGLDVAALPFGLNPEVRSVLAVAVARRYPSLAEGEAELVIHGLLAMWLRLGLQLVFRDDIDRARVADVLVTMTTGALGAYETSHERGKP